ncbi:MAG: AMP-dependent synthetase and ligase [Novosphingobium sp.]|nr:AMP-dependent synthetase and ligase [Novosphingobium sp.]
MSALLDAILIQADRNADKVVLDDGRRQIANRALRAEVAILADRIRTATGDRLGSVAITLDNGIDWVLADLALLQLGRACVPIPPFFTEAQRAATLADAGVIAVVTSDGSLPLDNPPADLPIGIAKISYTSGSTGSPKGICMAEAAMLATAQSIVDRLGAEMAGVHIPLLPLGVLLENVAGLYTILLAGGCYRPLPLAETGLASLFSPDAKAMFAAIERTTATSLILVPELLECLVTEMEGSRARLPRLRLVAVGGARVSIALLERAARVGLPVVQGYGLTECGSVVTIEAPDERIRGTVGRPLDHVALSLAPDGEILVTAPGFLGTVGSPRVPGPFRTGDVGTLDTDGRLSIVGRKSNLIITSFGRNIAPEWIEEVLVAQPQIAQAMVHGDGDGEAALQVLIVPMSIDADVASAVAAANATLPEYAQVADWRLSRPFLPVDATLTANGRLRRAAILEREAKLPFFERLVMATAPARSRLMAVPQLQAGLAGRISRTTYLAYLAQAFHHVRHTVPLMQIAQSRMLQKPRLHEALQAYIEEETGHEHWILADIRAAGGDPDRVIRHGPAPATERMVRHAYEIVTNANPVGFFGMVFVLEGTSIALASSGAEAVRDSLGLPPEAFTYLRSHGALDQDHMKFFEELVNGLEDPQDEAAVLAMANAMFDLFAGLFAGIPMEDDREAA